MKKKILKIALPAALTIVLIYSAFSLYQYQENKSQIKLYGNVDIKEVSTAFRVSGRLKNLFFDEGDAIKEGQLLAELENDTFANDLELAIANMEAARANLENAQRKFLRTKELFKNDSASKQEYDDDKFAFDKIKAEFEAQKARVKISQTTLNDTKLFSPSDAFVMTRAFEKGSMLAQNQTVYELSLTDQAYVRTYVSEENLGKISNGMEVKIKTDSDSEYEGVVGFISPKAEFTPKSVETTSLRTDLVYRLRITIKNPDIKLKQGMPVTVFIKLNSI
ncbi:MAG: efflux RND transporter periplasmic adaptor subunit [Proteobacteria bacterium]|nr:efflux RND transporter periplasmic adaptor subunit [Pseudomonadota bacterium]